MLPLSVTPLISGYSFFIGLFYLFTGKNWNAAFPIIAYAQIFLDSLAIYFVYKIGFKIFSGNKKSALATALIYASYPFIIVWTPVVYSESLAVFFLVTGYYFFVS